MEDRHYLSDPRPLPQLKDAPTWEVDVLREGVDLPILTLQISNANLPPRRRKKRVVWKLPDTLEHTPKFGKEDQKRILELFKERKKELKKQRKSLVLHRQASLGSGSRHGGGDIIDSDIANSSGVNTDIINTDITNSRDANGTVHPAPVSDSGGTGGSTNRGNRHESNRNDSSVSSTTSTVMTADTAETVNPAIDGDNDDVGIGVELIKGRDKDKEKPKTKGKHKHKMASGDKRPSLVQQKPPAADVPPPGFGAPATALGTHDGANKLAVSLGSANDATINGTKDLVAKITSPKTGKKKKKKKRVSVTEQSAVAATPATATPAAASPIDSSQQQQQQQQIDKDAMKMPTPQHLESPASDWNKSQSGASSLTDSQHQRSVSSRQSIDNDINANVNINNNPGPTANNSNINAPPTAPVHAYHSPPQHPHQAHRNLHHLSQQSQRQQQQQLPSMPPPPPGVTTPASPPPGLMWVNGTRQFVLPRNTNATLAQVVSETYFTCLNRGLIQELAAHFVPLACQKSITVGGAHAFCAGPLDIIRQLESLKAMVVQLKGVLQQTSVAGSILVITTGVCLSPQQAGLSFCHTLTLIPRASDGAGGVGYQIQNDALCFLSNEMPAGAV